MFFVIFPLFYFDVERIENGYKVRSFYFGEFYEHFSQFIHIFPHTSLNAIVVKVEFTKAAFFDIETADNMPFGVTRLNYSYYILENFENDQNEVYFRFLGHFQFIEHIEVFVECEDELEGPELKEIIKNLVNPLYYNCFFLVFLLIVLIFKKGNFYFCAICLLLCMLIMCFAGCDFGRVLGRIDFMIGTAGFYTYNDGISFDDQHFVETISSFGSDFVDCEKCKHEVKFTYVPDSTKRDVIMTAAFGRAFLDLAQVLIKSLRTAKSKSTLVIFTDQIDNTNEFRECGVIFIPTYNVPPGTLYCSRFLIYYKFLLKYRSLFNRVIISDLRDVFFNQDPFYDGFKHDDLVLSDEEEEASNCQFNSRWMSTLNINAEEHKINIYCAGLFGGGINQILSFLHAYILFIKGSNLCVGNDQAIFISIINSCYFNDFFGENLNSQPMNGSFSSLGKAASYIMGEPENFTWKNLTSLNIIHQYDRSPYVVNKINKSCVTKQEVNVEKNKTKF